MYFRALRLFTSHCLYIYMYWLMCALSIRFIRLSFIFTLFFGNGSSSAGPNRHTQTDRYIPYTLFTWCIYSIDFFYSNSPFYILFVFNLLSPCLFWVNRIYSLLVYFFAKYPVKAADRKQEQEQQQELDCTWDVRNA